MSNDALLKEARDIDKTREHWPLIKRLADALTAANAREAQANAERDEAVRRAAKWQRIRTPDHGPCCTCQACGEDYDSCRCDLDDVVDDLAQARTQLATLRKEAAEAIKAAYREGQSDYGANCCREKDTMPIQRTWINSTARRAAQRIGGAE